MKVLFLADIHIKFGRSKVPDKFQSKRLEMLAQQTVELCDKHLVNEVIIGGDILDVPDPSYLEVAEMLHFLKYIADNTGLDVYVFHGNHEAVSKVKGCLTPFNDLLENVYFISSLRSEAYDVIDYFELHAKQWVPAKSRLCFTHVRGEIPPHVKPEVDLDRFSKHGYDLVIAGDLHSRKNSQGIIQYPGSPYSTSFHKTEQKGTHGALVVDTDTLETNWCELKLPQMIRVEVKPGEDTTPPNDFHLYTYRVVGTLDEITANKVDKDIEVVVHREAAEVEEYEGDSMGEEVRDYAEKRLGITDVSVLSEIPSTVDRLNNDSN